jgi:hypothetical protein
MSSGKTKILASPSLRKIRSYGKVRCHNSSCMERLTPEPGSIQITWPNCGVTYRLYWVSPTLPRIRGPVWDVNRKLAEETVAKKLGSSADESE